jgi:hypothetical protein
MSVEGLNPLLEKSGDGQKQQHSNFKAAMETRRAAAELQRRTRKAADALIFLPSALTAVFVTLLVLGASIEL